MLEGAAPYGTTPNHLLLYESSVPVVSLVQAVAALAAKTRGMVVHGPALVAFDHLQRSAAVIAELSFSGRFTALGTEGLLTFNLAVKNLGLGGFFGNILHHFPRLGRGYFH